jgi:hypothetical protein
MMHFVLYGFSVFVFTVALFVSGVVIGQAIERARAEDRSFSDQP